MREPADESAWGFVTSHGLALLVIARDPSVRLRDIAEAIGVTERTAQRVVTDLTHAGYVQRERLHRRNVYTVRPDLPFRLPAELEATIGELLLSIAPTALARATQRTSDPLATTQPLVLPPQPSSPPAGRPAGAVAAPTRPS